MQIIANCNLKKNLSQYFLKEIFEKSDALFLVAFKLRFC